MHHARVLLACVRGTRQGRPYQHLNAHPLGLAEPIDALSHAKEDFSKSSAKYDCTKTDPHA